MTVQRKWLKMAMAAAAALLVAQVSVGALARTQLGRLYLRARLERAFGRPVEVRAFDAQVFPSLRLDAAGISVAEDPAFGNEYFLRAEKLTAGLRWLGLLRGHFEFGTLSLSRPSLILVRSAQGRWNLENWLPSSKSSETGSAPIYGPPTPPSAANRLQKIEFDDGRVNFKDGQDKQPFAFINVSGSVEQIATGRWQLQLAAQPWRSGVALQSAGTLSVRGDIAGTSSRLQPAFFQVHWTAVSLADLLRLLRGQDYGVRGAFTLDASAQSGGQSADGHTNRNAVASANALPLPSADAFDWTFALDARASGLHRWDLTERADNPALGLKVTGRWNAASRTLDATELLLDAPHSNLRGSLHLASASPSLEIDSAGIQAVDLLAWWRAFEPAVDDAVKVDQFFTGSASVRGWPPHVNQLAFSSAGGRLTIPGVAETIWIGAVQGGGDRDKLSIDPVRLQIGGARAPQPSAKRRPSAPLRDAADLSASEDFVRRQGGLVIEGQVEKVATILHLAAALGRPINHGWELDGRAQGSFEWDWNQPPAARWSGKLALSKSRLAVAGLNQPLQFADAALIWDQGRRTALLGTVEGFGTTWTGAIKESKSAGDAENPRWIFDLHGERLDAAEIDRWVGPRARPNWLQRLLTSLSGGASPSASPQETAVASFNNAAQATSASELLRRVDAEGNLTVNELIAEKLQLHEVHVAGSLRALHLELSDISAQWAGGKVRGTLSAKFAPRPLYDFTAQLDGIDLARLPVTPVVAEQWSGLANGSLRLTTAGVGREELLQNLEGQGKVAFRDVELLGWDLSASVADGAARAGVSRWTTGNGTFALRNKKVALENLRLDNGNELTLVNGMVDFSRTADLSIKTADGDKRASRVSFSERTLRIVGPLSTPSVTVEGMLARTAPGSSTP